MSKGLTIKDYNIDDIFYKTHGSGAPPVLMLHGWGGDPDVFNALALPISIHRQVYAPVFPGFGESPDPALPWNTQDYTLILHEWMVRLDLTKVDIIAHSFGGRVAIGLAARYPESVGRMVLISSAGLVLPRSVKIRFKMAVARFMSTLGRFGGSRLQGTLEKRRERLGSPDWRAASRVMRRTLSNVIREDLTAEIQQIQKKVLLVWGENDHDVLPSTGRKMAKLFSNSKYVEIPRAGHYPFLDNKGETLSVIWKHLELPPAW